MLRINFTRHLFRRKKLLQSLPAQSEPHFLFSSSNQLNDNIKLERENMDRFQRVIHRQIYFEIALFASAFAIGSYYFKHMNQSNQEEDKKSAKNIKTIFKSGSAEKINQVYEHHLLKVLKEVMVFHLMTRGEKSIRINFSHILGGLKGSVEKRKAFMTIKQSLTKMAALNRQFIYSPENKEQLLNPELFTRLKEFLIFKDTYVRNKIEEEIGWMFGLYQEDVYRLLSVLVTHYDLSRPSIIDEEDLEFFEKRMETVIQGNFTGAKAAALRYFYNKEAKEKNNPSFGDCLYFGNQELLKNGVNKGNLDILFIHGQGSHPIRGFKVKQDGPRKMDIETSWPVQFLKPQLEASGLIKPRIYLALLESGRTQTDLQSFNVPERSTQELAIEIEKEIRKHKIGQQNPLLIVGFSLGGIVAKRLLLRIKDLNVKGVLFIGVPHKGSEVVNETLKEVKDGFSGFTTFETSASHAITKEEFVNEFLDTCKLSITSKELSGSESKKKLAELDTAFRQLQVPSWCVSEGQKIKSKISPIKYHLVKPESALLDACIEKRHLDDKSHYDLAAVSGPQDETVKITKEFIGKVGGLNF